MNRVFSLIFLCIATLYVSGCAVGNKHNYHNVIAEMETANTFIVAIGTHDTRPYILNGDKEPNFVGLSRGGYGNPFNVTTLTGNTLAQDMSEAIKNSFVKKGYNAKIVHLDPHDDFNTAVDKLKQIKAFRLAYLQLTDWKSDTYANTALIYDAYLMIFNDNGQVLAKKMIQGNDNLKGSVMNPPGHAKKVVPVAFSQKLEELLNDPEVQKALE
jgi:hypothetical protein